MSSIYYKAFVALFLVAPPFLLAVRLLMPTRMPWWLLAVLAAFLGWVFANLAVHFYYEHVDDLLAEAGGIDNAPQQLVDQWQNDGAKLVFAYLFGWLYGLIYLLPWLVVYRLAIAARKGLMTRNSAA